MQPKALWVSIGCLLLIAGVFLATPLAHAQVFTDNLYYGLQNDSQVSQLQEFLTSQGLYKSPITGNFYFLTLNAVKAFQAQQGITPAAGFFGPITMAAANKIADAEVNASNAEAISETGTSTPPTQGTSTVQLQLQALLQEVALLQQQLATRQSSTQIIQNLQSQAQQQSQTLQQIQANTTPPVAIVPAPSPTSTPTPAPSNPSTPAIILEKIKLALSPPIGDGSSINSLYTGVSNNLSVILYDQNGNVITNASATIATDAGQITRANATVTYAGNCPGSTCGEQSNQPLPDSQVYYYYPFSYTPQTVGQHTITVSALGSTQTVIVTSEPQPTPQITVSLDLTSPAASNVVVGTTGDALAVFRFTETSNFDSARISNLTITDTVTSTGTSTSPGFSNLQLWYGSTLLGMAGAPTPTTSGSSYAYTFNLAPSVMVPQGNSASIMLKGDATNPGSSDVFSIANASSVIALGNQYNLLANITIVGATGNLQTVVAQ